MPDPCPTFSKTCFLRRKVASRPSANTASDLTAGQPTVGQRRQGDGMIDWRLLLNKGTARLKRLYTARVSSVLGREAQTGCPDPARLRHG
jgi:hypothetical protein